MIIRRDLTDERVLFCPLCCCNGQLSLIITVNHTVYINSAVPGPRGVCVCVSVCRLNDAPSQAYTKVIDALCLSPNSL